MPELRRGPIADRWVIIATERAKRPSDLLSEAEGALPRLEPAQCPFCPGNEAKTPPELFAIRNGGGPNTPGWRVRVVPNKFPALEAYDELGRAGIGFFDRMRGVGAHEVVIETPDHRLELADLPLEQVRFAIEVYIQRMRELMRNSWFRYILLFKNHGVAAGASLSHPHSQIIATPVVPRNVRDRLEAAKRYYEEKERCIFCDLLIQEQTLGGERIVEESDGYIVWAPYDSRFPFELVIFPKYHLHDFTGMNEEQRWGLARVLKRSLLRLKLLLNDPPFNMMLQTSPNPVPRPGKPSYWATLQYDYHWHLEILPRLTRVAGFEWGTGLYINPVPPEEAAEHLRGVQLPEGV
ncbi:MAG: galactose-1-phosphate uridylyltransferase [Candidatus Bipolaricaulia bacterium]